MLRCSLSLDKSRDAKQTISPATWRAQGVVAERVLAGEQAEPGVSPSEMRRHHRRPAPFALDVRELIRKHVFEQPVGSIFRPSIAYPWLRIMRLNSSSLDLELVTGRTVNVPLVWARCGVMGERMRLACPLCGRRVCTLYHLERRVACRRCHGLWYAAQRISSTARKFLTKRKIRRKLGDYGQIPRTAAVEAAQHVAADL